MIATLHDQPEFSELFMADLLSRNSRIEEDLIDQLFNSSEKRLARVLLLLANFGKEATVEPIIGNFSQETLAEMIGTTRSRVSFFMNKFRKLGYIEYNGKLEIRNSLLNVFLYDKPEIRKHDASEGPGPTRDGRFGVINVVSSTRRALRFSPDSAHIDASHRSATKSADA